MAEIASVCKVQFVLFGFRAHLALHLERSPSSHSNSYDSAGDRPLDRSPGVVEHTDVRERPNCIASYTAKSGSFVQYAG